MSASCRHEAYERAGNWCRCVDCGHSWDMTAPKVPKKRSFGKRIDALLDDAFTVLQHDTGESDPEWHHQRNHLAKKFEKTLASTRP